MSRAEVVQIKCDRCKRVEVAAPGPAKTQPDFDALFDGERVTYPDLCSRCKAAIKTAWAAVKEWQREVHQQFGYGSPTLLRIVTPPNTATPLVPAPNYTPPQPHAPSNHHAQPPPPPQVKK
jgi:hypothetical protein